MKENYILHKYLNGEATTQEVEELKASPEYAWYVKIAQATSGFEVPKFDAEANFETIQMQKSKRIGKKGLGHISKLMRVAAVVAVLFTGYLYVSSLQTTMSTKLAGKEIFTLPDNSIVELNANSEIRYKKRNWNEIRHISLNGEAYFKVNKGSMFEVETAQGVVTVLGTKFNVFSRDTIFNIACFKGLVNVSFNDTIIKLRAGNKLKIENNKLVVHTITNSKEPTWLYDESSFENASLATVLNELQHHYPVKITSPNSIKNKRFTGSFTHKNIEFALQSICAPLRLGYTVNGNEVIIYAK